MAALALLLPSALSLSLFLPPFTLPHSIHAQHLHLPLPFFHRPLSIRFNLELSPSRSPYIDLFPVSRGSLAPSLPPHPLNFLVTRSQNHLLPRNRLQRLKETKFLDRTFLSRTRRQESPVEDRGKSGRSDAESVERMKVFTLQGSTSSFASLSLR